VNILIGAFWILLAVICFVDARRWNRLGKMTLYRFFLLDGKLRLGGFVATMTAANLSIGNFLVFVASWGYLFGPVGIFWFVINLIMNVVGFRFFFPAFKSYIEDHGNSGTIHDYLSGAFSHDAPHLRSYIRIGASIITVVGLLFAIVFELSLAVDLLAPGGPLDRVVLFSCLTFLICLFTSYGGFKTLITTDICQSLMLAIATIAMVVLMGIGFSRHQKPIADYLWHSGNWGTFGWPNVVTILVIGTGWMLVAMDQWQRTCAARSYPTSLKGVYIYLGIVAMFGLAYGCWGMYDNRVILPMLNAEQLKHHLGDSNPLADLPLLSTGSGRSGGILAVVFCGLVAAALSTTNTFLTVCSHSITSDVLVVSLAKRSIHDLKSDEQRLFVGVARSVIVGMGALVIITYAIFIYGQFLTDALNFFFIAYSVQFALLAPMVMSALTTKLRPGAIAALTSISLGFLTSLIAGFSFWEATQQKAGPWFGIAASDWLALTPALTLLVGLVPLCLAAVRRRIGGDATSFGTH
jgi:Na+/proline symporter